MFQYSRLILNRSLLLKDQKEISATTKVTLCKEEVKQFQVPSESINRVKFV